MVVQASGSGAEEDGPRIASEAPAMLTPVEEVTIGDDRDIESGKTPAEVLPMESPEVKRATDKIVSNAVSIDVIAPASRKDRENGSDQGAGGCEGRAGMEKEKGPGRENVFTRLFRRIMKGRSQTQIAILCIFPFVEFFAATVISIQGPFFPSVARDKGATNFESGLVLGCFELVVFTMAPIYGSNMGKLGPNRLFNYGIFTTSLCCVVFGFLHHVPSRFGFIALTLLVRVIEAIGDAAFVTASFSIIAAEFPDSVATTFAMMETFYGLGMIAGPTVGGALYEAAGFTLPFAFMGVCLFICAIATYIYITKVSTDDTNNVVANSGFDMFRMLKIPAIALTAYGTFAAATGIGFLTNNLEYHLEQFGLNKFHVGCIFMLNGGVYALSAPVWGKLCDKTSQLKVFSVVGAVLTILGFVLIGPLPFFSSWSPSILVICIGLILFGFGLGSTLVSAFIQFLHDALANGHPENVTTHGLVSGLWTSMTALGFFVGPTAGGFLNDLVDFRWATLFVILEHILLIALLVRFFVQRRKAPSPEDTATKDNLDDIVITYALKMNTPKPQARKKSSNSLKTPVDADSDAINGGATTASSANELDIKPCAPPITDLPSNGHSAGDNNGTANALNNTEESVDPIKTEQNEPAVVQPSDIDEPSADKAIPVSKTEASNKEGLDNPNYVGDS